MRARSNNLWYFWVSRSVSSSDLQYQLKVRPQTSSLHSICFLRYRRVAERTRAIFIHLLVPRSGVMSPLKITRAETQGRREKTCGELLNAVERSRTIRVPPYPCRIFIHLLVPRSGVVSPV